MSKITKVLITLPLSELQIKNLQRLSKNIQIHHIPTTDPNDILAEIWEEIEVLYTDGLFPGEDQAPHLRWIQSSNEKIHNQKEAELDSRKNIQITTMEGINSIQVAEHAVALLLALSRKLAQLFNLQENNEWLTNPEKNYHPHEIFGSTVGIVGYKGVGRQIARLLSSFGCTILASKENAMKPKSDRYSLDDTGDPEGEFFTRLYPTQALSSMFKECDSVIITRSFSDNTIDLLGEKELEGLNSNALLVDVSEGGVVNIEALTDLMADNKIAGAAIDVFHETPLPADNLLWSLPNVIISPNVSNQSKKHDQRKHELFEKNIMRYLDGQRLFNLRTIKAE